MDALGSVSPGAAQREASNPCHAVGSPSHSPDAGDEGREMGGSRFGMKHLASEAVDGFNLPRERQMRERVSRSLGTIALVMGISLAGGSPAAAVRSNSHTPNQLHAGTTTPSIMRKSEKDPNIGFKWGVA